MEIKRGEIYMVALDPTLGHEMKKTRPAIVVSNDSINKSASVVSVCPITDAANKTSPIHIEIPSGEGGLSKASVAHCGQVRSIDKVRLVTRLGILSSSRMAKVSEGLREALGV